MSIVHVDFVATLMAFLSSMSSFKMVGSFFCFMLECFIFFTVADISLRSVDRKISTIEFGNNHKIHLPNDDCEDPYEEDEEYAETESLEDSCIEFVSFFKKHFGNLSKH